MKILLLLGCIVMFLAVALGAFGAHALKKDFPQTCSAYSRQEFNIKSLMDWVCYCLEFLLTALSILLSS